MTKPKNTPAKAAPIAASPSPAPTASTAPASPWENAAQGADSAIAGEGAPTSTAPVADSENLGPPAGSPPPGDPPVNPATGEDVVDTGLAADAAAQATAELGNGGGAEPPVAPVEEGPSDEELEEAARSNAAVAAQNFAERVSQLSAEEQVEFQAFIEGAATKELDRIERRRRARAIEVNLVDPTSHYGTRVDAALAEQREGNS